MTTAMRYGPDEAKRIMALADTPDMRDQRRRVIELLAPRRGWCVLDVGCGPGHLAGELVAAVPEGAVSAVDVSPDMLSLARSRASVEFELTRGTELPSPTTRSMQRWTREWGYGMSYRSHRHRNRALPHWLDHYNRHRPHSSIGGLPPISRVHNLRGQDS